MTRHMRAIYVLNVRLIPADSLILRTQIYINKGLYANILSVFRYMDHEKGGLLFLKENEIVDYFYDIYGKVSTKTYTPSSKLNRSITDMKQKNLDYAFIHSHPDNYPLSNGDIRYIRVFMKNNSISSMYSFIVSNECITGYQITDCSVVNLSVIAV